MTMNCGVCFVSLLCFIIHRVHSLSCTVYLYTGSNWDGTEYGPYTLTSTDTDCSNSCSFANDNIYSMTVTAGSNTDCNVTIFAAGNFAQDWDRYYTYAGNTRYINYDTTTDASYDNTGTSYVVWESGTSQFSSMIIKGSDATCSVTLYTGKYWTGTSYGDYGIGIYCDGSGCSYNDLIYSMVIESAKGYVCNVTIFAAVSLAQDWDRFYSSNGEIRYVNFNTTPDAYYDNGATSYRVWGDTYSQFSSMIVNAYDWQPTKEPTTMPSIMPTNKPSSEPSHQPSNDPSSREPSMQPSDKPTAMPSNEPSGQPSDEPSSEPSREPSNNPSIEPSNKPSNVPSNEPSNGPSDVPSNEPSDRPTNEPSVKPSNDPSEMPSNRPTFVSTNVAVSSTTTRTMSSATSTMSTSNEGNENGESNSGSSSNSNEALSGSDYLLLAISVLLFLLLCTGCGLLFVLYRKHKAKEKRTNMQMAMANGDNNDNAGDKHGSLLHVSSLSHSTNLQMTNMVGSNALDTAASPNYSDNKNNNNNNNKDGLMMKEEMDMIDKVLENNKYQPSVTPFGNNGAHHGTGGGVGGDSMAMAGEGNDDAYDAAITIASGEGANMNGVTGMNENDGNRGMDTGNIINIHGKNLQIHGNWDEWDSVDVNEWLKRELLNTKFNVNTINQFMIQFEEIDMTGKILQLWLKESNGDSDKLLRKLQSKIDFKPKSLIWDVVIQAMMNL